MNSCVGRRALQCAALCVLLVLCGYPLGAQAQGQGVAGGSDVVLNSAVRADSNSYRINFSEGSNQGIRLSGAGDIDGDDRTDFLMGTLHYEPSEGLSGVMYLVAAADLAGADAADGTTDRVVDSSHIAAQPNARLRRSRMSMSGQTVQTVSRAADTWGVAIEVPMTGHGMAYRPETTMRTVSLT